MSRPLLVVSVIALAAMGCGSDSSFNTGATQPPVLAAVVLSSTMSALPLGEYIRLSATARDQRGQPIDVPVTWTSSDASVFTVSTSGVIVPVKLGVATVTAAAGGHSASLALTVVPSRIVSLTMTPTGALLRQGDSLRVSVSGRDAAQNLISNVVPLWSSSNAALVAVDQGGMVRVARGTGVGGGIVGIVATAGTATTQFNASLADWSRNTLVDVQTQKPYTSLSIPARVGGAVMFVRCYQDNISFYFTNSGSAIADGNIMYRFSGSNFVPVTWPLTNSQVVSAPDPGTAQNFAIWVATTDTLFLTWHPTPSVTQTSWFLSKNLADYLPALFTECKVPPSPWDY